LLERSQIVSHVWILRRQGVDIADFDIDSLYAGPFCARAEKPAPLSNDARSVKRIARDQKLHLLAGTEIWTDYDMLACTIFVQHKNFNRIAEITVIKLIVANAVKSHGRIRRHHEIQCRACWSAIKKWCWEPTGRNSLIADKCDAHKTARGVRL
jgi:hypothetical protein